MSSEELARAWVQTFNDGDFERNLKLGHEDGYFGITGPSAGTTRAAGDQDARMWKAAVPDARGEITRVVTHGDTTALEIVWTGTQTGDLPNLPATGKRASVLAAVFLTERDGQIARIMHYFDFAGLLAQLGAMPGGEGAISK
ncbi:MAG: ester cyclase [Thermomicrobia bacterium]|nr:ester cyclase [Thermomicrobia bacterium]MCA1725216.1 ester cyclase [Thermomicrobia bacterium]